MPFFTGELLPYNHIGKYRVITHVTYTCNNILYLNILRGNYTPSQIWAFFVHYLKIVNSCFEK